jgi:hypothetical protein
MSLIISFKPAAFWLKQVTVASFLDSPKEASAVIGFEKKTIAAVLGHI